MIEMEDMGLMWVVSIALGVLSIGCFYLAARRKIDVGEEGE